MDRKCIDLRRFILTGTPGSGKSSVIMALEKLGHTVIHEAATYVIRQEQVKGEMRPWESHDFIEKIIHMQKDRQMSATLDLQFYDRAPFCTYALAKYLSYIKNIEFVPSHILLNEIDRCLTNRVYQNKLFFFENLGFIEHTDARKISYEDSLLFEQIHLDIYKYFGFKIILVQKATIMERCEFILESYL
jgi:predicted ATPase